MIIFCIGIFRFGYYTNDTGDQLLAHKNGKQIYAEGIIVEEPILNSDSTKYVVKLDTYSPILFAHKKLGIKYETKNSSFKPTKIIVVGDMYRHFEYGDRVSVAGKLEIPTSQNPNSQFDYRLYLAKDKIFYIVKHAHMNFLEKHKGNLFQEKLFHIKNSFLNSIEKNFPMPEAGLLEGELIEGKKALPTNIQNEFIRSGTIQVVVLSGYNITVVAESIMVIFSFLPFFLQSICGGLSITIFTLMAGTTATVVRAYIMALLIIFSKLLRRNYDTKWALIITAVIMIYINPMILVFDPSFQLSCICTIGIILVSPIIERYTQRIPQFFKIRETFVASIATQLFVLPFLLYLTNQFSIVSLPANMLLMIVVPLTMLCGFVSGLIGMLSSIVTFPFMAVTYILLRYQMKMVDIFSSFPFAQITLHSFPSWLLLLSYAGYVVILYRLNKPGKLHISET